MKSVIILGVIVLLAMSTQTALAIDLNRDQLLRYSDLETLAKASMVAETTRVNEELAKGSLDIAGYKKNSFSFLEKQMGKNRIDPQFLFNKCIMDSKSVAAILSTTLTTDNDAVSPRIGSLSGVRANYSRQIWRMTSKMCQLSQARFILRLQSLSSNGKPVNLNPLAVTNLSKLVFFPTEFGKPCLKSALSGELGVLLTAALIAGSAASMVGAPFAGVVISLAVISSSSMGLKNSLPKAENKLRNLEFAEISPDGLIRVDLNDDELGLNQ